MAKFRGYKNLEELISDIKERPGVYYQAPLDSEPHYVSVKQYTINNRNPLWSKATLWNPATKTFVVNLWKHFDRFHTLEE